MNGNASAQTDVSFIGFLFADAVEGEIALRWARRLAPLLGPYAPLLRPETPLSDILEWAALCRIDPFDFAMVFEPELRSVTREFLKDPENITFREMVVYFANCFR